MMDVFGNRADLEADTQDFLLKYHRDIAAAEAKERQHQRAFEQEAEQLAMAREVGDMHTMELLNDRGKTHGAFEDNALNGQMLRALFRGSKGWQTATPVTREALDQIASKLARIMSGMPNVVQHWEDIAGYAILVVEGGQP